MIRREGSKPPSFQSPKGRLQTRPIPPGQGTWDGFQSPKGRLQTLANAKFAVFVYGFNPQREGYKLKK